MKHALFLTVLVFMIVLSYNAYAYTIIANDLYCGNCTDCTNAINNGTLISRTIYLNVSISGQSGTCINAPTNFSNRTFDCQGYTISGDRLGTDYAITTGGTNRNSTIKNCMFKDFYNAIDLEGSPNTTIANNTIYSNTNDGIYISGAVNSTLINNTFNSSSNAGIELSSSTNATIKNNTANSNTWYGIYLQTSSESNVITNNTVNSNSNYGIYASLSNKNNLTYNNASSNTIQDFTFSASKYNFIINNTVFVTKLRAFSFISASANNTISNNTVYTHSGFSDTYGFQFSVTSNNNTITYNTLNGTAYGIYSSQSSYNTIRNNTATSNTYGIYIYRTSANNTIANNTANSNTYGIGIVTSYNNTLENNSMTSNTYNFFVDGSDNSQYVNNVSITNTIDSGYPIYYNYSLSNYVFNTTTAPNAGMIICANCNGITVTGLNLSHSGLEGVYLFNTTNSTIQNVTASNNGYGVYLRLSSNNTISNDTANSNTYKGVFLNSTSINNTVANNTIGSSQYGIQIYGSSTNNTLVNNTITSMTIYGIHFDSSNNNTVANSTLNYTLELDYSNDSRIINNTFYNNGASMLWSSNNTIFNNTFYGQNLSGIGVAVSTYCYNNTIINNSMSSYQYGVYLYASNNTIIGNNTINSNYYGIYILTYSAFNSLGSNSLSSNGFGIDLAGTIQNNLSNNVMTSNVYGLMFEPSTDTSHYNNYISEDNSVNGKYTYYYRNQNLAILSPTNPGFVGCWNCSNVTMRDFSVSENGEGIILAATNNSNITNVTIGDNYIGFLFDTPSQNNTISNSFLYSNRYRAVIDYGTNNIFVNNIYMYDIIAPSTNVWYSNFTEYSFKLTNLTYGNASCSLNIDSKNVSTNDTIYNETKSPFTYSTPEGTHTYAFSCIDRNSTNYFNFSTTAITFGIKYSDGLACSLSDQCKSGYCVHNICRSSDPYCGDGFCDFGESCNLDCSGSGYGGSITTPPTEKETSPETLPGDITFPSTILNNANGVINVPQGGAVVSLPIDGKLMTDQNGYPTAFLLLSSSGFANVSRTEEIKSSQYKEVKCYQKIIASYVLEVSAKEKYLCLNMEDYINKNLTDIKIYKFIGNDWEELTARNYSGKICSSITSTPYMITGFQESATQQDALIKVMNANYVVDDAVKKGYDIEQSKNLLSEANTAYENCEYDKATGLAVKAIEYASVIRIPNYMIYLIIIIISIILLFIFRKKLKKIKLKKLK